MRLPRHPQPCGHTPPEPCHWPAELACAWRSGGPAHTLPNTFVAIENIAGSPAVHEMGRANPYDTERIISNPHAPSTSDGRDSPPPYESKVDAGYM
eukprot:scaffold88891_cov55-Phaeocystis_antarctica.AAC.9